VHGVYIGINDRTPENKAPYCVQCTPSGPTDMARFHMPTTHHDGGNRANRRDYANACPECGSEIHSCATEKSTKVECADCGTKYRRRLRAHEEIEQ